MSEYKIQSVLFNKNKYTPEQAEIWLKDHKFKLKKIDKTENYLRFRQYSPAYLKKLGYTEIRNQRIGKITDKEPQIYLVLCYKK